MIIDETQDVYDAPGSIEILVKGLCGQAIIVKTSSGACSVIIQFPTIGVDDGGAKWLLGYLADEQDT